MQSKKSGSLTTTFVFMLSMSKNFHRFIFVICCAIIIISLCSWGFYVHETATQLAVYQLPKNLRRFFFSNIDSLTAHSIRPDKRRYTDKAENPKHFIDLEAYSNDAVNEMPHNWEDAIKKYSLDTLKKYGFIPYQVLIGYDSLVNAFKQKNAERIIFMLMIWRIILKMLMCLYTLQLIMMGN